MGLRYCDVKRSHVLATIVTWQWSTNCCILPGPSVSWNVACALVCSGLPTEQNTLSSAAVHEYNFA